MLPENKANPLLSPEENNYLAAIRQGQTNDHAEQSESHDSYVMEYHAYHAGPTNVDWRRVYQTAIATTAGISAIHCIASAISLAGRASNDTEYLIMAAHDLPMIGIASALAYAAIVFQRNTLFATIATAGAAVGALVIGGAA